jgi:DNA topoisomerase-1
MRRVRRGRGFAVKDLRTWHGTMLAAPAAVDADPPVNNTIIKNG